MQDQPAFHCLSCALRQDRNVAQCPRCLQPFRGTASQRVTGLAFLLSELAGPVMTNSLVGAQRDELARHYTQELRAATEPKAEAEPAPAIRHEIKPAAAAPAPPARLARDWSWLLEQQASLFLFAGAFLTVIAALIYVGYSGQAVSGSLKLSLLILYTSAFLAGGVICMRMPRVELAGKVFFAVGAMLLPMNFVAAHELRTGGGLDAETLWLAGSIATAGFYASVALLGLGRPYGFASGVALMSAGLAALVVLDVSPVWMPFGLLLLTSAMAASLHSGHARFRRHLAHPLATMSMLFAVPLLLAAIATAPAVASSSWEIAETRWYLPATFLAFGTHAVVLLTSRRTLYPALGALAGGSGAVVTVVYAMSWPAEHYATGFGSLAVLLGLTSVALRGTGRGELPASPSELVRHAGVAATLAAAAVIAGALFLAADVPETFTLTDRWFIIPAALLTVAFYATDLFVLRQRAATAGIALSLAAVGAGVAYALAASADYYALAALAPALPLGLVARFARPSEPWRADLWSHGTIAAGAGAALSLAVAGVAGAAWEPSSRWTLPLTLAGASAYFALYASERTRLETSVAMLAGVTSTALALVYALELQAAYYGVVLACAAIVLAVGGRIWAPAWLARDARDGVAAVAMTAAWLPFRATYHALPEAGVAVHLTAALFYGAAAFGDQREVRVASVLEDARLSSVRLSHGWLYLAALTLTLGYVDLLRGLPAAEGAEAGALAPPLALLAMSSALLAATSRRWRPDCGAHLYVVASLVAVASLAIAPDAATLAVLLTVYVALFAAAAAWERAPEIAVLSAALGLAAVVAWQQQLAFSIALIPIVYSGAGVALYGAGAVVAKRSVPWHDVLRALGALYAVAAPVAGFALIAAYDAHALLDSALYHWSVLAVTIVGALAIVESFVSGRRWIVVPASAVLVIALLLEIASFRPANVQAYTLVIGGYILLLGIVGLWRLRLIPKLADSAPYLEALGAAIVMYPSFAQSFGGGWHFLLVLLVEASAVLLASVALRRLGLLAAALLFLALFAARAIFDAANALPNWLVIMLAGTALLAIGVGILTAREQWSTWQRRILAWSDGPANGHAGHPHGA